MSTKKYCKYSLENLKNAIEAIKHGMPCSTAAKKYNVPRTTLIGKLNGTYPEECRSGASTVLTSEEEKILAEWIVNMARMGFPITKVQLLDSVTLLIKNLKRPNKFNNGRPGRHWFEGFLQKHPQISQRMTQNLTTSRAAVSQKSIQNWFDEINNYFTSADIKIEDPQRIFNADESAFFLSPKGNLVLTKKGSKSVYERSGNDKECLTVLITGNAAGQLAPPMVMYPYARIPKTIVMQVPNEWGIGKSESGWMTSESFYEYVTNIFYPWLVSMKITFPILLYVDGHKSHITLPLSDFCREKQIILISLLPNSTHILQPLDVGLFRSLKIAWRKSIRDYRTENQFKNLNREQFAPVLKTTLDSITNIENIFANAFRTCGLCPFDKNNVDYSKVLENNQTLQGSIHPKEDPEVVKHLRFIEQHIDETTLKKFYLSKGADWEGSDTDKSLYIFWWKIFKKSGLSLDSERANDETNNIVIEVEDGLTLEKGWEDLVVFEQDVADMNFTPDFDELNDENVPDLANEFDEEQPMLNDDEQGQQILEKNPCDNRIGINVLQNIRIFPDGDIQDTLNVVTTAEDMAEQKKTEESVQNGVPTKTEVRKEDGKENIMHNTPNKSTDVCIPGIVVPSPFKKALFWPETPSSNGPFKKSKEKIPSVTTSDAWKSYYKKKEEEKKKQAEEKADRKRKREEKKILKENGTASEKYKKRQAKNKETKRAKCEGFETEEEEDEVEETDDSVDLEKEEEEFDKKDVSFQIEDYVIVKFNELLLPGQIIEDDIKNYQVRYNINHMEKKGLNWVWPEKKDMFWYDEDEIVKKIDPPILKNKRGLFCVKEMSDYVQA